MRLASPAPSRRPGTDQEPPGTADYEECARAVAPVMREDPGFAVDAGLQIGEAGLGLAGERQLALVAGIEKPEAARKSGQGKQEMD